MLGIDRCRGVPFVLLPSESNGTQSKVELNRLWISRELVYYVIIIKSCFNYPHY